MGGRCHLEAFVHGNMDAVEAKEVSEALQKTAGKGDTCVNERRVLTAYRMLGSGCIATAADMTFNSNTILPSSSRCCFVPQVLGPGCTATTTDMPRDATIILPSSSDLLALNRNSEPGSSSGRGAAGAEQQGAQSGEADRAPGESRG
eukprot:622163-Pelagomonas_calceolata.AAC.1